MRRTTVIGLTEPTPVSLRGQVLSSNSQHSPVTHERAALVKWYLFARGAGDRFDALIDRGIIGQALLFKAHGGLVRLPTRALEVYFAAANAVGQRVPPDLPEPFRSLALSAEAHTRAARGELYYREHRLISGVPARLRATVAPLEGTGYYRVPADAQFVVRDDLETPSLSVDVAEMA